MKLIKNFILLAFVLNLNLVSAQLEQWKQLADFKAALDKTFPPAEDGDILPLKLYINDLATTSNAITVASIPKRFDNEHIPDALNGLKKQTKLLKALIDKNADKVEVIHCLQNVRDVYRAIVRLCLKK